LALTKSGKGIPMAVKQYVLGTILAASLAGTARADIAFEALPGPPAPGNEENVMFEAGALVPALSITGDTNKTNTPVIFDTNFAKGTVGTNNGGAGTGQFINADGLGQANVVCVGAPGTACVTAAKPNSLQSLEMKPGPGFAWTDVLANPDFGSGTMNVYVRDNTGLSFDFTLGKGQNFFSLLATNGEVITDIQMTQETGTAGPFGWSDFKQPRISGVCSLNAAGTVCTPVPEPASLALLASGLLGLGLLKRRWSK